MIDALYLNNNHRYVIINAPDVIMNANSQRTESQRKKSPRYCTGISPSVYWIMRLLFHEFSLTYLQPWTQAYRWL